MFLRESEHEAARRVFTRRAAVLGAAQFVGFGALAARLYQIQVLESGLYRPLADTNRLSTYALAPLRGRILDSRGKVLADTAEGFHCYLTPSLAGNVGQILDALARIFPIDDETRAEVLARAMRQSPNAPILVGNGLTWQQAAQANVHAPVLPGVQIEIAGRRRYHGGVPMGHIVGHVGAVERFALDDRPELRLRDMKIGKTGVERGMDAVLRGKAGAVRREIDARGRIVRQLSRVEPLRGRDVILTIDTRLQSRIMRRLEFFRRAACVVIDTATGDLAAMASTPGYDPGPLLHGLSSDRWTRLRDAPDDPMINRTIQGLYPPGSTFKMVTGLAALEAGIISPDESIVCRGAVTVAGVKFRCWNRSGHGPCDLHRGLRESCDVYFYEVARRVGIRRIAEMGRKLGLGQTFDNGIALQRKGLLPDPDWKRAKYGRGWYTGETMHAGIGQGYVLATPLQLAVMAARLASGRALVPRLARPVDTAFDSALLHARLPLASANLERIRRAMVAVVNERAGTGKRARLEDSNLVFAGKTGTSQIARSSSRRSNSALKWNLRDHALFVGFVEGEDRQAPRFALSVIVEHGGSGGKVAAPLARDIVGDVIDHHRTQAGTTALAGQSERPGAAAVD